MNRSFEEIYEKIKLNNLEEINSVTKRKNVTLIILLILVLILVFFNKIVFCNNIVTIIFFLIFLSIILINILVTRKYKKLFKEVIIKKMIELYDSKLNYLAKSGISILKYKESNFYKDFDKYYSEDLISGNILDKYFFEMAEVRTKKIEIIRDDKGNITGREEDIVFNGLFGTVDLNIENSLEINVATNTINSKYKNARIERDSAEFEKNYDIFSNNKIKALEIFTSEVIDEINNFKTNIGKPIQIRIKNSKLFFNVYLRRNIRAASI